MTLKRYSSVTANNVKAGLSMMSEWITTEDAAEIPNYNVEYVRRLIRKGRLTAQKSNNVWLVNVDAVLQLKEILDQQKKRNVSSSSQKRE